MAKKDEFRKVKKSEDELREIYNSCQVRATKGCHSFRYDILHELSHGILGESCCREHCEFEAHGGAVMLAFILGIDIGDADERMNGYAGCSYRKACGRIQWMKKNKK